MRTIVTLALALTLTSASGCSWLCSALCGTDAPPEFVVRVKDNTDDILPKYKAYLAADPDLPDSSKQRRLDQVLEFEKLVAEEAERNSGD